MSDSSVPVARADVVLQAVENPVDPLVLPNMQELARTKTREDGSFVLAVPDNPALIIRVVGERCRWNEYAQRLDPDDLNEVLEISVNAWDC